MGALHAGHTSLIDMARQKAGQNGTVIVSIYVNPIQFDRPDDLKSYPRSNQADLKLCQDHKADLVFLPTDEEMYLPNHSIKVIETEISKTLCGASRPGHFDGVCTVVLKLFNLSNCDAAVFGEKDYQQLSIIRRMVRDLDLNVEVIVHPTVREADGLAMSSRNKLLTEENRKLAPLINQMIQSGPADLNEPKAQAELVDAIQQKTSARFEYLTEVENLDPATRQIQWAAYLGHVRLIDSLKLKT